MILQVPPAIIEKVGQGSTAELARLRGIQSALQHLEMSVEAVYVETATPRKTDIKQTIMVQVNVNGIPGVEITREYRQGNTFYAEVRFDQERARQLAVSKVNGDVEELDWLLSRPRTPGRKRGLNRVWVQTQQDIRVCNLLGAQGFKVPNRGIQEEFRGPRLNFVDDGRWSYSTDLSQRDLTARICQLYGDPEGQRDVRVQVQYNVFTTLGRNEATHSVKLTVSLNGNPHTFCEEIVTPRTQRPTPSQILGAFGTHLEELISSY
jgi:hypothetical protein